MRGRRLIGIGILAAMVALSSSALAGVEPEPILAEKPHEAAAEHGATAEHEHADEPKGEPDHWSALNWVIPHTVIGSMRKAWGKTWLFGDPQPDRTMHVVMGVVVAILALFLTTLALRRTRQGGPEAILPESRFGLFTFFEVLAEALLGMMQDTMGKKQARFFFPLMLSFAIFILFGNLLGAIPGFLPATDNFNTTLALGLVVFVTTHIYGIKEHGFGHYFAHFLGPIRAWYALPLMLIMVFIEIVSHIARPMSLGVRLMGNMFADHKVLSVFLGFGVVLLPLPVMLLGFLVAIVQTLVFCLLSVVYISMAVEHADH